jgi:hypothetical protein
LWWAGRDGNRYAAGGEIFAVSSNSIPAGGVIQRFEALDTAGFPAGHYRYYVQYKQLWPDGGSVIQMLSVDIANTTEPLDSTPPTLTMPPNVVVDATSPAGASVAVTATATDAVDPSPSVECAPTGTLPIGDTTVTCTARDSSGNVTSGSVVVHVRGAAEQLSALIDAVVATNAKQGIVTSLQAKLEAVRLALSAANAGSRADACAKLTAFKEAVAAQSGKELTTVQARDLGASATRIRAVLGCTS